MKKIIITAHPSSKGFTHQIAKNFKKGAEAGKHGVEILDLYHSDFLQNFLQFKSVKELSFDEKREYFQNKIKEADELVFIFPIWWGTCPAVMKNFFDSNFTSGFAYLMGDRGIEKLLKGKGARIFATCDGPSLLYSFSLSPTKITWKYFMLGFCGVRLKSFVIFGRMFKQGENVRKKWLDRIYEMGKSSK